MSNTRTLTDRTLANRHVADVLDEQTGNLTQNHFRKDGAYKRVHGMLEQVARRAIQCALAKQPVSKPDLTKRNWRGNFATAVERAMIDAGFESDVEGYVQQFLQTLPKVVGHRAKTKYCYFKIASYAGQCATMLIHRLDPDLLSMPDDEAMETLLHVADIAIQAGVPTMIIVPQ